MNIRSSTSGTQENIDQQESDSNEIDINDESKPEPMVTTGVESEIANNAESKAEAADVVEEGEIVLPDDVVTLIAAIKDSSAKKVLACIKGGVNLNALIPANIATSFHSSRVKSNKELSTPLGLAISKLDYNIVKTLLENGANPNMLGSDNRSMIETLMCGIGHIICRQVLNQPIKQNLRLSVTFSLPIKVKTTMKEKVIKTAEAILDLLLSYDLKSDVEWTEVFNGATKELTEASGYEHNGIARRKAAPKRFDAILKVAGVKGEIFVIRCGSCGTLGNK